MVSLLFLIMQDLIRKKGDKMTVADCIAEHVLDYDRFNIYQVDDDISYNYLTGGEAISIFGKEHVLIDLDLGNKILEIWIERD